jgi:hypothetical protein
MDCEDQLIAFHEPQALTLAGFTRVCPHKFQNSRKLFGSEIYLMQFTGLHDKDGKEIYEGNIINHSWGRSEVRYVAPTFVAFEQIEKDHIGHWTLEGNPNIEVIGNIYENPELLKYAAKTREPS